jgi:hypothetical protein
MLRIVAVRPQVQRRTAYKISCFLGRALLDLRIPGPFEAKYCARGRKIDPPGASGRVFDLECDLVVVTAVVVDPRTNPTERLYSMLRNSASGP